MAARALTIYETCVLSKLLYSRDSVWLLRVERIRLDAFHCRSLRRIMGQRATGLSTGWRECQTWGVPNTAGKNARPGRFHSDKWAFESNEG